MERFFAGSFAIAVVSFMLTSSIASAQLRGGTVQLPTFRYFAISTTVEVPDGGSASLGGDNSASFGRSERGIPGLGARPFDNVGTSSRAAGGSISISAEIHDFDAMDRQLLADGVAIDGGPTPDSIARQSLPLMLRGPGFNGEPSLRDVVEGRASRSGSTNGGMPSNQVANNAADFGRSTKSSVSSGAGYGAATSPLAIDSAGASSIAELRQRQSAEDAAENAEAAKLIEQARQLTAAGKLGVARVYYQTALRRSTGDLKRQVVAAMQALDQTAEAKGSVAARTNW